MSKLFTRGIFLCSTGSSLESKQVVMFYTELGSSNPGSLGIANNCRVPYRIPQGTIPKQASKQLQSFLKRAGVNRPGGGVYAVQRDNQGNPPSRESGRFLLKPIPCPQEGWENKTSNEPEETQRVNPSSALQDGGHSYSERPAKRERLAHQGGSKRCLFYGSDSRDGQEIPPLPGEGKLLPIHLPPLQCIMCPLGLYQDPKASDGYAQRARGEASVLYRRHSCDG